MSNAARSRYTGFRATIKAVGTGPRGSRALSFDGARAAMAAVLSGETTDAQAGAFLMAMRMKGEEPQELAGLAHGLRDAALSRDREAGRPPRREALPRRLRPPAVRSAHRRSAGCAGR